jgi:nucleoside-diphosphate-sugar epimerase
VKSHPSTPRRILVAGCGYLGETVADLFKDSGWQVEAWTASSVSAEKLSAKGLTSHRRDISDRDEVVRLAGNFDVVIHCASTRGGNVDLYRRTYLDGARNLVDAFADSKIVFVSSTSVYAQTDGEWVTEESPAEPRHERGRILREAEQLVLEHGGVVVRLGGIHGPHRSYFLESLVNGKAMISKLDRYVNQVHRDDAAAAISLLVTQTAAHGEIFNVVDGAPMLQGECYRWLATKLNRPAPPVGERTAEPKRGRSNKRVSNAKLRALGWMPQFSPFAEAMEKSVLPSFGL